MGNIVDKIDEFIPPIDDKTIIFVVKPDGVKRNLTQIVKRILFDAGFVELYCVTKVLTANDVKILYKATFEEDFPMGIDDPRTYKHIEHMRIGPCIALLMRHKNINKPMLYSYSREIRGEHWIPAKCSSNSIRFILRDKSFDNYEPIFENGFILGEMPSSIIHATLSDVELSHAFFVFFTNSDSYGIRQFPQPN